MTNQTDSVVYVVRDSNRRTFLNRRVYSGRVRGIWGRLSEANVFDTYAEASSCATNINRRRPERYSAYQAEVYPIVMQKNTRERTRGTRTSR